MRTIRRGRAEVVALIAAQQYRLSVRNLSAILNPGPAINRPLRVPPYPGTFCNTSRLGTRLQSGEAPPLPALQDIQRIDLRVGRILSIEIHPEADEYGYSRIDLALLST